MMSHLELLGIKVDEVMMSMKHGWRKEETHTEILEDLIMVIHFINRREHTN